MIRYVLYIWNSDLKRFCYSEQIEYQSKIVEGESIRWRMKKFKVMSVDHDFDANIVDLYLEEEVT